MSDKKEPIDKWPRSRIIVADYRLAKDSHLSFISVNHVWVAGVEVECLVNTALVSDTNILYPGNMR